MENLFAGIIMSDEVVVMSNEQEKLVKSLSTVDQHINRPVGFLKETAIALLKNNVFCVEDMVGLDIEDFGGVPKGGLEPVHEVVVLWALSARVVDALNAAVNDEGRNYE